MRAFAISAAKAPRLAPAVRDPGRGQAGHQNLRDVRGTEHGFDEGHGGAALDAMRARILGMQRRVVDRLPGGSRFLAGLWSRSPLRIAVKRTGGCRRARALTQFFGSRNYRPICCLKSSISAAHALYRLSA